MRFADPPSPLIVRNRVLVATDALLAYVADLDQFIWECESDNRLLAGMSAQVSLGALRQKIEHSHLVNAQLVTELYRLRSGVLRAEAGYSAVERAAVGIKDLFASWASGWLGRLGAPVAPFAAGGLWLGWQLLPGSEKHKRDMLQRFILTHPEIITSPEFVKFVSRLVTNADDLFLGAAGAPLWLAPFLGEQGLGILNVGTSAGTLMGVGRFIGWGVLSETPVQIEKTTQQNISTAPEGASERLARIPEKEQVRIERYTAPGKADRYIVYVAPTRDMSPLAGAEPWDMTSNISAMAAQSGASLRATEMAMADAGILAESEIMLVGYSQGGLVADRIAASGEWNVVALESYGAPGSGVTLPDGVCGVSVRHSDDFVTATGFVQDATDRTIVERQAYPDSSAIPKDLPVPAHQKRAYAQTAELLGAARSPELRAELARLTDFTEKYVTQDGSEITEFVYRAERVPDPLREAVRRPRRLS